MTEIQEDKIESIVSFFRNEKQIEIAIEEAAEFIQAAQKVKRYPDEPKRKENLIEETADMLICAEQMRRILGTEEVDAIVDKKLNRTMRFIMAKGEQK